MRNNGYGDIVYPGSRDFATSDEYRPSDRSFERMQEEQRTADLDAEAERKLAETQDA